MSIPGAPDPSGEVQIRWIEPEGFACRGANRVRDEERGKHPAKRADVFAIDLHSTGVTSALEWAKTYRDGQAPEDPPVCMVVYGREITPEEQAQFALAGIHAIDVFRKELGLNGLGSGDMLANLIRSMVLASPLVAANPSPSQGGPSSSDWLPYTSQPSHVPSPALDALFEELARDERRWWERDS